MFKIQIKSKHKLLFRHWLSLPTNNQSETKLRFYVPFTVEIDDNKGVFDTYDIGNILANDREVAAALFNEDIEISEYKGNSGYYILSKVENKSPFKYLYVLGSTSFKKMTLDNNVSGTLFEVKIPKINDISDEDANKTQTYIRFRIKTNSDDGLMKLTTARDSSSNVIKGTFVKTLLMDLRFNDYRKVDNKVLEKVLNGNCNELATFDTVHFFYITDINESIYDASARRNDIRLLEHDLWFKYLNDIPHQYPRLAYHWKQKCKDNNQIKNFSLFFRIDYNNIDYWNFAAYIALVIVFSEFGSQITYQQPGNKSIPWLHIVSNILLAILIVIFACRYFHSILKSNNKH